MQLRDELILLLVDKVLLALLAGLVWHFYRRWQQRLERERDRADRLEQEIRDLKSASALKEVDQRIQFLENSLNEFYWPLVLCLRKDDAVWQRVPALYEDGTKLPTKAGIEIESQFLIPNHEKAIVIIESGFRYVAGDETLTESLLHYIRHVTVFKSLRSTGAELNPIDVDEPFPVDLADQLQANMASSRSELILLRKTRADHALDDQQ